MDKIYFQPGDVVTIRQNIPNKPIMIVSKKEVLTFKPNDDRDRDYLKGIRCIWFTTDGKIQEHVFNTKDLELITE